MISYISNLLLATSVSVQQKVYDWADSVQSHVHVSGFVPADPIVIQCDWVNMAKPLESQAVDFIGNTWGLVSTYGGYAVMMLAIIIAVLGKFAFARRLTGTFLWLIVGLLAVGVVLQIIQGSVGSPCG